MANLGGNFNANEYEPMQDFSPLPAGEYVVVMTDSEVKATKDGTNQYLNCKFEVIDGEKKGRLLFSRLNLWHQGTAGDIARRELATIGKACGVMNASDSSEFHNKPMVAVVAIRPAKDGYPASNEIKNYKATGGAAPAPQVQAPQVQAAAPFGSPAPVQAAPTAGKPWERR